MPFGNNLTDFDTLTADEKAAIDSQRETIERMAAQHEDNEIDRARANTKATLEFLTDAESGAYTKEAEGDPELIAIIDNVRKYAKMDVTAIGGDYNKERELFLKMQKQVDAYMEKKEALMQDEVSDSEDFRKQYLIGANLKNFLSAQANGTLLKTAVDDPNTVRINAVDNGMTPVPGGIDIMRDAKDMPLFPHDPSPNDISQGYLGDCYMISALSTLATRFPEKIRDNMVDNGDGTVTVRFFQKNLNENSGKMEGYIPVLVTVDKKFPLARGSQDCLWVQILERAYAASGLHLQGPNSRPVPPNITELYQDLLEKQKRGEELPTHEEYPWIIDEENKLKPWKPTYEMISGGQPSQFLEQFLGNDAPGIRYSLEDVRKEVNNDVVNYADAPEELGNRMYASWGRHDELEQKQPGDWSSKAIDPYTKTACLFLDKLPNELTDEESMIGIRLSAIISVIPTVTPKGKNDSQQFVQDMENLLINALNGTVPELTGGDRADRKHFRDFVKELQDDPVFKSNKDAILSRMMPMLHETFGQWADSYASVPYSGKYNGIEKEVLQKIQQNISEGHLLNAGTLGTSDRNIREGVVDNHAYSLLGVTKHALYEGGPELTFIRVRNPHGRTGRTYAVDPETHAVTPKADPMRNTGGIFEVELGDFCREFDDVYINKLSPEMLDKEQLVPPEEQQRRAEMKAEKQRAEEVNRLAEEIKRLAKKAKDLGEEAKAQKNNQAGQAEVSPEPEKAPQPAPSPQPEAKSEPERLTYQKMGEVGRPFRKSVAALHQTSNRLVKSSPEYNAFLEKSEIFLEKYLGGEMLGDTIKGCRGYFKDLADSGEAYLKHCAENPRSGSRRATRMREANVIVNLCKAHMANMDPIEYAKNQIAEQMYSEITKVQLAQVDSDVVQQMKATFEDQNVKQQSIDTLKKSAQFQNMTDNLSFDKLSDMMQNSKDTYRKLTSTQNQMKSQKAPIKQQPVRQKAVQQNQPQAGGIKK